MKDKNLYPWQQEAIDKMLENNIAYLCWPTRPIITTKTECFVLVRNKGKKKLFYNGTGYATGVGHRHHWTPDLHEAVKYSSFDEAKDAIDSKGFSQNYKRVLRVEQVAPLSQPEKGLTYNRKACEDNKRTIRHFRTYIDNLKADNIEFTTEKIKTPHGYIFTADCNEAKVSMFIDTVYHSVLLFKDGKPIFVPEEPGRRARGH